MPEGFDLGISGLASNFDWRGFIDQLTDLERAPQRRLVADQQSIGVRKTAYASIATQLGVLQNRVQALKETSLFDARLGKVSDEKIATATASAGTALGSYAFHISQLATAAVRQGTSNVGSALNATNDVSALTLSGAAFSLPVKAGVFTVNGHQVTIATTDTLQQVFDKISAATGGDVSASYDSVTDRIALTSGNEIVLGSATDTSNFLQSAKLSNNGTGSITSASLGSVRMSGPLSSANLATAISDGGNGEGKFKINGIEITFNASADSLSQVLARINNSNAGVTASYDSVSDRFLLTNKSTGDIGIALEDVTGNFLAATGLSGGTLQRGDDLLYTINNGGQLSSHSNTIAEDSSGIDGVFLTVLDEGDVILNVTSDTTKIKAAINDFITEYNKAQALIDTNTASSTDAKGKVTAGTLASESDAFNIAGRLRAMVVSEFAFLTGTIKRLESIGITTNGDNNNLTLSDSEKLDSALVNNLSEVRDLFTNESNGLAPKLDDYLEKTVGEEGTLETKQDNLDKQVTAIDQQISEQERLVQAHRDQLIAGFIAMERAQQQINQQLQFLAQRFNSSTQ